MSSTTTELQHCSATAMGDTTTKSEVLEILDLIQEGIESSVYFRFGKRQKKLKLLSRVRQKVLASTDQLSLARAMEGDAVSDASCMPTLRRKAMTKGKEEVGELRLQVTSALKFLNSRARRTRKESSLEVVKEGEEVRVQVAHVEDATPPALDETYDDELSEDSTADAASGNYDGDTEKDAMSTTGLSSCESTNDGDNDDDDDDDLFNGQDDQSSSHVITTCSVQDENGPLGFSITTWRKHTLKESSGRGGLLGQAKGARTATASTKSNPNEEEEELLAKDASSATEESTSDSQNIKLGGGNGTESDEALEQVSVRFGKGGIVHASRTRSVRFKGIKPSSEDNIFRAKELLERYRS